MDFVNTLSESFLAFFKILGDYLLRNDYGGFFGYLFVHGGWMLLFTMFFTGAFATHTNYRQGLFQKKFKWVLLAVDIPALNEQTPRAVENIFAHLAGAHSTRDLVEKYWVGEVQRWFSFEIVSINGYIQFIIATEKKHRDLVEALLYAQYPDANLTEIEDYCQWAPHHYPDPNYKVWGTEFIPTNKDYTDPIRTWPDFEDPVTGVYKDPMAGILETFSRVGKGEQLWMQILVLPIGQKWVNKGIKRANEIMGKEEEHHESVVHKAINAPINMAQQLAGFAMTGEIAAGGHEEKKEIDFGALRLTPIDIGTIKSIGEKISRVGFGVKIRTVYIAHNSVYNKNKVHHAIVGAMKQFNDDSGNGFKPDTKGSMVTAHYLFAEGRKNFKRTELVEFYQARSISNGPPPYILNARELATVWHFPMLEVKVAALKRAEVKTSRPPTQLPLESDYTNPVPPLPQPHGHGGGHGSSHGTAPARGASTGSNHHGTPPSNLPFVD